MDEHVAPVEFLHRLNVHVHGVGEGV